MSGLNHVELYTGEDGDWWFRSIAENGEQITRSSEGYRNKGDALAAIRIAHGETVAIQDPLDLEPGGIVEPATGAELEAGETVVPLADQADA